jgi:hypothetical protein
VTSQKTAFFIVTTAPLQGLIIHTHIFGHLLKQEFERRYVGRCGPLDRECTWQSASYHLAVPVTAHFSFYELYAALTKRLTKHNVTKWRFRPRTYRGHCPCGHNALTPHRTAPMKWVRCQRRLFSLLPRTAQEYVRFEVYTAANMKNAVFWDIKPSSYLTGDTLHLLCRAQPVNAMKDFRFSRRWLWS